jgi:hypothetical protein
MTASVVWWSEFLSTDPEVWARFPALPDFLRSLERDPPSLVSTAEEQLERKSSGYDLESRGADRVAFFNRQKLALTSPTQTTEFFMGNEPLYSLTSLQ